ncbi:MAG TPA: 2OG-Fe(II) oxygenase [Gammaproteobacteria bacterium]|nr:2OG-Fe(II) oxygenase [Gammaproteobacteria bacterium]
MQPTREHSIEGHSIRIYDGLLQEQAIHALTAALDEGGFVRSEIARPDTQAFRHWALNIPLEAAVKLPVYQPTLDAMRQFSSEARHHIYRCYCNYASYGDMLFTHTDCDPGTTDLTALWFIAPHWDVEWGGETLFFNSSLDAEVVVSPRPGRLVMFEGVLRHVGRPPNRICFNPRYTLAFKLMPGNEMQDDKSPA